MCVCMCMCVCMRSHTERGERDVCMHVCDEKLGCAAAHLPQVERDGAESRMPP